MLILLNLKVTLYRIYHFFHTALFYYPRFLSTDLKLARYYLFKSPYHCCSDYGETPIVTVDKIATRFRILSHHKVIELGCGAGRPALWLNCFIGCNVVAVDHTGIFIRRAKQVSQAITFLCEDILESNLDGDFIYFYGTSFSEDFIHKLASKIKKQRVITVSFPLSDYDARFKTVDHFRGSFPWGKTEIYLNSL